MLQMLFLVLLIFPIVTMGETYGSWRPQGFAGERINPNKNFLVGNEAEKSFVINHYTATPGCYISCIGHSEGIYKIGSRFYMHGLIRVQGAYRSDTPTNHQPSRLCYPKTIENSITVQKYYINLCNESFSSCRKGCWGSNDTGGFFTRAPQDSK